MNVFGEGEKEGLTNPLTEDLLASNFNALAFNEVHLNELHDNSGTGKIVVHEEFNMTNNQISNLADPTQNKDAANKQYVDNAISNVFVPYDVMFAFSDETSPLATGAPLPVKNFIPRGFNIDSGSATSIMAYLSTATTNNMGCAVLRNDTVIQELFFPAGSRVTNNVLTPTVSSLNPGDEITLYTTITDPTASGIKLVISGSY